MVAARAGARTRAWSAGDVVGLAGRAVLIIASRAGAACPRRAAELNERRSNFSPTAAPLRYGLLVTRSTRPSAVRRLGRPRGLGPHVGTANVPIYGPLGPIAAQAVERTLGSDERRHRIARIPTQALLILIVGVRAERKNVYFDCRGQGVAQGGLAVVGQRREHVLAHGPARGPPRVGVLQESLPRGHPAGDGGLDRRPSDRRPGGDRPDAVGPVPCGSLEAHVHGGPVGCDRRPTLPHPQNRGHGASLANIGVTPRRPTSERSSSAGFLCLSTKDSRSTYGRHPRPRRLARSP
jgi:hypothetical protein